MIDINLTIASVDATGNFSLRVDFKCYKYILPSLGSLWKLKEIWGVRFYVIAWKYCNIIVIDIL